MTTRLTTPAAPGLSPGSHSCSSAGSVSAGAAASGDAAGCLLGSSKQRDRDYTPCVNSEDMILSAHVGTNDVVFEKLMRLHVPDGAIVADVTWGKGTFWKCVPPGRYTLLKSDLKSGTDCRCLPYSDSSIDCVILDPPYMEGFFRPKGGQLAHTKSDFRDRYSNGEVLEMHGLKYHPAVLDLYKRAAQEAKRVLRPKGVLVVKCQDEVSNHKQNLTHVEIVVECAKVGYYCKDLFVVVRRDTPHGKRIHKQQHARKNHSYFLVFVKQ